MFKTITIILTFLVIGSNSAIAQQFEILVDSRDSKKYKTIVIGNQTWMAENLNFEIENSWTYENKPENGNKFGRLYNWDAANKACPAGWHLPTDGEWKELEKFLGMSDIELNKNDQWRGTNEGEKLISDTTIGFNVNLGGYRNPPSNYNLIGSQGFYWTASLEYDSAWFRQFYGKIKQVFRRSRPKSWAFSVRCVKN